jgi:hypothetical protein
MAEGYTVAELLTRISANMDLTPDAGVNDTRVYQAITAAGRAAATWQGTDWWWLHGQGSFVPVNATISTAVRTTNVVTITTAAAHGVAVGQYVRIVGVADGTMDGTFPVATAADTTHITYADPGDDSASTGGMLYSGDYTLRTVNSNEMASLRAVERVYNDDDWILQPVKWRSYRSANQIAYNQNENRSTAYSVTEQSNTGPILHLLPIPNTTDRIYVDYAKFHKKIALGVADTELIIPFDYQEGAYIAGATFLLRRDVGDIASLKQCPEFVEAMDRMQASNPLSYDKDPDDQYFEPYGAGEGMLPNDVQVFWYSDGTFTISNKVSL